MDAKIVLFNALTAYIEDSAGAESEETKGIEKAWKEVSKVLDVMPNGFVSWYETFFEITQGITSELVSPNPKGIVGKIQYLQGHAGLYDLAYELTNEFEKKFKGREWDGEFYEEVEAFLTEKLKVDGE